MESMIESCRNHSRNVKHWQDETMALRWCAAAGMVDADEQFRRSMVTCNDGPFDRSRMNRSQTACRSRKCQNQQVQPHQQRSLMTIEPPPTIYEVRDILRLADQSAVSRSAEAARSSSSGW